MDTNSAAQRSRRLFRMFWITFKRLGKVILIGLGVYVVILLVGLIPVNNDFEQTPDGVLVHVISSSVHADIVVPITHPEMDWKTILPADAFETDFSEATHAAFGWGDRGFYVETPAWSDLKLTTACKALLLPTECCLHVQLLRITDPPESSRSVRLSDEQYRKLVDCIKDSMVTTENGRAMTIPDAHYNQADAFFTAPGNYHVLNTCNSWAGWCLRSSGVRTPLLTPLPGSPTIYFDD